MSALPLFEDFSNPKKPPEPAAPTPVAPIEPDVSQKSFDEGYKAGWSDGAASVETEQTRLVSDISTALQEAGFTYFEARQHVMNSMRPLLEAMVSQILPKIAKECIAPRVVDEIEAVAKKVESPIMLVCAPDCLAELTSIVERDVSFPVRIEAEETLVSSQIVLDYDNGSTRLDFDELIGSIQTQIAEFFSMSSQEGQSNG